MVRAACGYENGESLTTHNIEVIRSQSNYEWRKQGTRNTQAQRLHHAVCQSSKTDKTKLILLDMYN